MAQRAGASPPAVLLSTRPPHRTAFFLERGRGVRSRAQGVAPAKRKLSVLLENADTIDREQTQARSGMSTAPRGPAASKEHNCKCPPSPTSSRSSAYRGTRAARRGRSLHRIDRSIVTIAFCTASRARRRMALHRRADRDTARGFRKAQGELGRVKAR